MQITSAPVVSPDGSTVYVGSEDNNVYALNAADGSLLWKYATGSGVYSSPRLSADGATLFVGSYDNNVYALRTGYVPPTQPPVR